MERIDVADADVGEEAAFLAPVDLGLRPRQHLEPAMQPLQRIVISVGELGGDLGRACATNILTR